MEVHMSTRKVIHEIKLPLSLTIILGVIAFGFVANVFKPVFKIDEAVASNTSLTKADVRDVLNGCNGLINARFIHIKCN
jgi:hypothetical protein